MNVRKKTRISIFWTVLYAFSITFFYHSYIHSIENPALYAVILCAIFLPIWLRCFRKGTHDLEILSVLLGAVCLYETMEDVQNRRNIPITFFVLSAIGMFMLVLKLHAVKPAAVICTGASALLLLRLLVFMPGAKDSGIRLCPARDSYDTSETDTRYLIFEKFSDRWWENLTEEGKLYAIEEAAQYALHQCGQQDHPSAEPADFVPEDENLPFDGMIYLRDSRRILIDQDTLAAAGPQEILSAVWYFAYQTEADLEEQAVSALPEEYQNLYFFQDINAYRKDKASRSEMLWEQAEGKSSIILTEIILEEDSCPSDSEDQ